MTRWRLNWNARRNVSAPLTVHGRSKGHKPMGRSIMVVKQRNLQPRVRLRFLYHTCY